MAAEAEAAREARAKVNKQLSDESFQKYLENISIIFSKVIAAEGEQKASRALREASNTIAESSSALQLRYLQVTFLVVVVVVVMVVVVVVASNTILMRMIFQTLNSISAEKNSTIIFPIPLDIMSNFMR